MQLLDNVHLYDLALFYGQTALIVGSGWLVGFSMLKFLLNTHMNVVAIGLEQHAPLGLRRVMNNH